MINNYELMQYFLDTLKEFAVSNAQKTLTSDFVYSELIRFNIRNDQLPSYNIEHNFPSWKQRYKHNNNIDVFKVENRSFLWFTKGKIKGNEVKLYVPLDYNHIKEGANKLFDFVASIGIMHQSKIASIVRNDNIVLRVNDLEDAQKIINFVNSDSYLKEGLIKVNPFLPNYNGVGITMDNKFSYNDELSKIISNFIEYLKKYNRLDLLTVEQLNAYITNNISNINDLDLKDIYSLLAKTTSKNFELQQFIDHANNKLVDKYTSDRNRIVDPKYYLENAIKVTETYYKGNSRTAILEYLKSNPKYFTNKERAREGLIKYVRPGDLIWIMRSKLQENNIPIPKNDGELIDKYLNIILDKQNNYLEQFEIIKRAYINTLSTYNDLQAKTALRELIQNNEIKYFTNRFNDRTNLKNMILGHDIKRIILSNIDINSIDINNINNIILRFIETISYEQNSKKTY